MSTQDCAIAIMAAGKGTRLRSKRPKVLHEIGGKPLLLHVLAAAAQVVPTQDIVVITGHHAEAVQAAVTSAPGFESVRFVLQAEQRGTGDAIRSTRSAVSGYKTLIVLSGDAPLIRPETIQALREFHAGQHAAMTILTAVPSHPTGYGRVIRKSSDPSQIDFSQVVAIIEQKALTPEQLSAPEVNSGFYAFETAPLFANIDRLTTANAHGEYYLTDMAAILNGSGERVAALEAATVTEILGANTIAEMMHLDAALRLATAQKLMAAGVTIFRPETTVIDASVTVGADTVIEPYVQLLGNTRIGQDCTIRSYSVIQDSTLGDSVLVRNGCILDHATIASGAFLGPYSHLRPDSFIGESAHVGNFVETKSARIGKGAKANHLTYLGNAEIGEGTNIGAGTITCNYDGVNKHTTRIGDHSFIGSNSSLVAPVSIGDGAFVAAASCITKDVPSEALAIGRAHQTTKLDWAKSRRAKQKSAADPGKK